MLIALSSVIMSRTTLDLDPSVIEELRRRSRRERKSMGRVASELLAPALSEKGQGGQRFAWRTRNLGQPLVDLEDKEAVQAILDRRA